MEIDDNIRKELRKASDELNKQIEAYVKYLISLRLGVEVKIVINDNSALAFVRDRDKGGSWVLVIESTNNKSGKVTSRPLVSCSIKERQLAITYFGALHNGLVVNANREIERIKEATECVKHFLFTMQQSQSSDSVADTTSEGKPDEKR